MTIKNLFLSIIASLFLLAFFTKCTEDNLGITSGLITYNISYPDFDKENNQFTYMLLPKKNLFFFKDDTIHSQIKKALVEINLYTDTKQKEITTDFQFNKRTASILSDSEKAKMIASLGKYTLHTNETNDTLAGFICNKRNVTLPDGSTAEICYTNTIKIVDPNWYTPFKEIDGVLLKYTVIQNGIKMQFTADGFQTLENNPHNFKIDENVTKVSYDVMKTQMDNMFNEFMN